jgi:hypothetical protein
MFEKIDLSNIQIECPLADLVTKRANVPKNSIWGGHFRFHKSAPTY